VQQDKLGCGQQTIEGIKKDGKFMNNKTKEEEEKSDIRSSIFFASLFLLIVIIDLVLYSLEIDLTPIFGFKGNFLSGAAPAAAGAIGLTIRIVRICYRRKKAKRKMETP
jgi:hypothetical protein